MQFLYFLLTLCAICRGAKLGSFLNDDLLDADLRMEENVEHHDFNDTVGPYPELDKNGMLGTQFKWPNGRVPFVLSAGFSTQELALISTAMNRINSATGGCVQFVPRTLTDTTSFVTFIKPSEDDRLCKSSLGRIPTGGNKIWLNKCSYGSVLHEMLHTLGFYHEHQRIERWFYVRIIPENIKDYDDVEFRSANFDIKLTNWLGVPYDYDSVMHYGATAGAKTDGAVTIYPYWRPFNRKSLGQRRDLSAGDIQKLKNLYC